MKFRRELPAQSFGGKLRGKPAVIIELTVLLRFGRRRKGDTGSMELYATAPVGTEVWLRYEVVYSRGRDLERAQWQCLARVTESELLRRGTRTHFPYYRTTFVLIGTPEVEPGG